MLGACRAVTATEVPHAVTTLPTRWSGGRTGSDPISAKAALARASASARTVVIGLEDCWPSTAPTRVTLRPSTLLWASNKKHPPAAASVPVLMPMIPSRPKS